MVPVINFESMKVEWFMHDISQGTDCEIAFRWMPRHLT